MAEEISEAIKEKKLVVGSKSVIKAIKNGIISCVFFANNTPSQVMKDLERYSKITKIELKEFRGNSVQLGQFCGKPFKILIVGIKSNK